MFRVSKKVQSENISLGTQTGQKVMGIFSQIKQNPFQYRAKITRFINLSWAGHRLGTVVDWL